MDLGTFFVNQVIVHQIPKALVAEKATVQPALSQVPSELTNRLRTYFRERINASLRRSQFAIERHPDYASPVPQGVVEFFTTNGDNLVPMSQTVAQHLFAVQTGTSSAGILAVIDGTIGSGAKAGKCLAILKLEMDAALRIEPTEVNGQATFDLHVNEVTLNENATVFKAALFERVADLASVRGVASDHQRDESRYGSEVASFFLRFLGCRLATTAERATKEYIERVDEFVNTIIAEPEKKLRYELAALAELGSQSTQIDPQTFAQSHIDPEDRDTFISLFRQEDGSIPIVTKDNSLIRNRLTTAYIEFANGLRLSGPRQAMEEVQIDGQQTVIPSAVRHVGRRG
jgi:37-kD nucleoid-associated bacterial protein